MAGLQDLGGPIDPRSLDTGTPRPFEDRIELDAPPTEPGTPRSWRAGVSGRGVRRGGLDRGGGYNPSERSDVRSSPNQVSANPECTRVWGRRTSFSIERIGPKRRCGFVRPINPAGTASIRYQVDEEWRNKGPG
jgi:hypothetical protein